MQISLDPALRKESSDILLGTQGKMQESQSVKLHNSSFRLDIQGGMREGEILQEKASSFQELIQQDGMSGSKEELNYMMVMSNTMSTDDYAALLKDGVNPNRMDVESETSIMDQIKLAMLQGGADIVGYTDDISAGSVEAAVGNKGYAAHLIKQARDMAMQLQSPSDASMLYMVDHQLEPTIQNLYKAQFASGSADAPESGYAPNSSAYATTEMGGYLGKTAGMDGLEELMGQIGTLIQESGLDNTAQSMEHAKILLKHGRALTGENLERFAKLKELQLPMSEEQLDEKLMLAMESGILPVDADLTETETLPQKAVRIDQETQALTGDVLSVPMAEHRPVTLQQLQRAKQQMQSTQQESAFATAKRQLAEVQLTMSVEANLHLLKQGVQIETTELSELVTKLKQAESEIAQSQVHIASEVSEQFTAMGSLPAEVIGLAAAEKIAFTAVSLTESGQAIASRYEQAQESYEALQTAPRADLGDSIKTAFRNVNDLLEELDLAVTEDHARAVRILGYNRMEITEENLQKVLTADRTVRELIGAMTPGRALAMIRDGINPLTTDMKELSTYLHQAEESFAEDSEKYSSFLAKMELNHAVSEEEKEAYIGVYRLIRQIEKSDGAAIGYLVNTGAEVDFKNLLSATRSGKRGRMDIRADEQFAGVDAVAKNTTITEQLSQITRIAYAKELAGQMEDVTEQPEVLTQELKAWKASFEQPEDTVRFLGQSDADVTSANLVAADTMLHHRGDLMAGINRQLKKQKDPESALPEGLDRELLTEAADTLSAALQEMHDRFVSKEEATAGYEQMADRVTEVLSQLEEISDVTSLDLKALQATYHQLELGRSLVREETYEVPVSINGELTSINVRFVHGTGNSGATAMMEVSEIGRVAVNFRMGASGRVETLMMAQYGAGVRYLGEKKSTLQDKLSAILPEEAIAQIPVVRVDEIDLLGSGSRGGQENALTPDSLYQCAKAFIETMQEQ